MERADRVGVKATATRLPWSKEGRCRLTSREVAAVAYLDVMPGISDEYVKFRRAAEALSEQEKNVLLDTVQGQRWIGSEH